MQWEHRLLGDHVLLRADGVATYQLANPLDDLHHRMTHVIRGDDLLSSTPRQKLLLEALGHTYPVTAHLPMILGADKKRLSKRHGAASVEEFRDAGYLPEAVVNYLALVGWSFDDATEIMSIAELVERFTIERVSTSPGVFDHQKLAWMNGVHLRTLDPGRVRRPAARRSCATAARRSPTGPRSTRSCRSCRRRSRRWASSRSSPASCSIRWSTTRTPGRRWRRCPRRRRSWTAA